jgi:hypothetical protein
VATIRLANESNYVILDVVLALEGVQLDPISGC